MFRWTAALVIVSLVAADMPLAMARQTPATAPTDAAVEPELVVKDADGGVNVLFENPFDYPITVTYKLTVRENIRPSRPVPLTVTVAAKRTVELVQLFEVDRNKGWRYYHTWHWMDGPTGVKHDDACVYTLPFPPGHGYRVMQGYDGDSSHKGIKALDWAMPPGTPVCAARDGRVVRVVEDFAGSGAVEPLQQENNELYVQHDDRTIGRYVHFKTGGVHVKVGDVVKAGDELGLSGSVGHATRPHLHFEVLAAKDGHTRVTFPTRFATADSLDPLIPQKDNWYQRPLADQKPGEKRTAVNAVEAIVTCKGIRENEPVDITDTFPASEQLTVHVMLGVPAARTVRVEFATRGGSLPALTKQLEAEDGWTKVYTTIDLADAPALRGDCTAKVFLDGKEMRMVTFKVK